MANLGWVKKELNKEKRKSYHVYSPDIDGNTSLKIAKAINYNTVFEADTAIKREGCKVYEYYQHYYDELLPNIENFWMYMNRIINQLKDSTCFNVNYHDKQINVGNDFELKTLEKYLYDMRASKELLYKTMTYDDDELLRRARVAQKSLNNKAKAKAEQAMNSIYNLSVYKEENAKTNGKIRYQIVEKKHNVI